MECLIFALILFTTAFAPAASIEKLIASQNPAPVGSDVTLFSPPNVKTLVWLFESDVIALTLNGGAIISDNWIPRVTLHSNSSLTLNSVKQNDSGSYSLAVLNSSPVKLTLSVQVPISNVTMWANATDLVEFNDTAVLKCSALIGSHLSYTWLKGGSVVTKGQLSDGGATLTIVGVTRYDNGWYSCNVSNGVSHECSLPLYLNISYGPSNTSMVIVPMRSHYEVGSDITMTCSADSSPAAIVQWMVDGMYLNHSGPQLQLEMVTESHSGNYKCVVRNTVTSRFSSQSALIRILDPRNYVRVEAPITPAKEGDNYVLTCNVTEPAMHVHWWKNGEPLHEDSTTVFNLENMTVTFYPLERNHTGDYRCTATASLWNLTSHPHNLVVNYGPETPAVEGPDFAEAGQSATFHCSAMSMPPSQFSWWFNGFNVGNSSVFTTDILSTNMSEKITCKAYNLVTGKNVTKSKMLTVIEKVSVMIRNNTVPINYKNFTLTCDATIPYNMIYWMKDNVPLNMTHSAVDPHMSYHIENNKLHFTPLTRGDNGTYHCLADNYASSGYDLLVNYGPLSVKILDSTKPGPIVSLTCSADSQPDCDFQWFFNGQQSMAVHTGPIYTFLRNNESQGNYTCKAKNPVTNITMYQTTALSVAAFSFPSQAVVTLTGLFALSVPVLFH
ncbi:cell adhesion molecule CEACAM5 [Gasterosteus aculeatus]